MAILNFVTILCELIFYLNRRLQRIQILLNSYGYNISDNDLINISLDVAEHNYEVPEIAEKLSKMIYVM